MAYRAADCSRVYTPHGKLAHLLGPHESPSLGYAFSLCHRQPRLFGVWLGTGSQGEYEHAAELPLCGRTPAQAEWGNVIHLAGGNWDVWRPADLRSGRVQRELEAIR